MVDTPAMIRVVERSESRDRQSPVSKAKVKQMAATRKEVQLNLIKVGVQVVIKC